MKKLCRNWKNLRKRDPNEETLPDTRREEGERSKIKIKRIQEIENETLRCRKEIIADGKSAPEYQQNDCT